MRPLTILPALAIWSDRLAGEANRRDPTIALALKRAIPVFTSKASSLGEGRAVFTEQQRTSAENSKPSFTNN
jgi:hypothetical protein